MKYDIEAIARGQHEVNTKELSPIESIQLGLKVREYQEDNGLTKGSEIDYEAVATFLPKR